MKAYVGTTNGKGEPHGEGRRTFSSGHVYDGQWKAGRCDGFGRFIYPDGQIFEGQWEDGQRNGPGTLSMPNGETISGSWTNDTLNGNVRRWQKPEEAPASPTVQERSMVETSSVRSTSMPGIPRQRCGTADDADVLWLRESHDVIWQLNVELQMENEKLVAENRRLRLKLRTVLQEKQVGHSGVCQHCRPVHAHGASVGCQYYHDCEPPKVVEGKLKKKKMPMPDDGGYDATWIRKLLDKQLPQPQPPAPTTSEILVPEVVDPKERCRRILHELCERAQAELMEQIRLPHWATVKRLDSAGEVERFAIDVLKSQLDPIRSKLYESDRGLPDAAASIRAALSAVAGWPDGLETIFTKTRLDVDGLLRTTELQLDGCALSASGAGAAVVLIRSSRQLRSLDLGNNAIGDVGATMIADVLRVASGLTTLRLYDNRITAAGGVALAAMLSNNQGLSRLDLRGNNFDVLSEAALRRAGEARVILTERELSSVADFLDAGVAAAGGSVQSSSASEFLAQSSRGDYFPRTAAGGTSGSNDAEAFLRSAVS